MSALSALGPLEPIPQEDVEGDNPTYGAEIAVGSGREKRIGRRDAEATEKDAENGEEK